MKFISRMNIPSSLMALIGSIYITQYLGLAFIMAAAVAILRQEGVSLEKLALLNLMALPLLGKVLYAPLVDRYTLFFKGQYRSWLLNAQFIMAASLFVVGILDLKKDLSFIIVLLSLYALATALQDVAIDGLACKLFNKDQRKYANGIQFSGNLLGNVIGGGVLLMAYPVLAWQGVLWVLAGLTFVSWFQLLFFKEPDEHFVTAEKQKMRDILRDCKIFIAQNKHWFKWLLIYPLPMSGVFALLNPFLVDQGWTLAAVGFALKVYGSLVGVFSALAISFLIAKWGRVTTLKKLTWALAVVLLLILPLFFGVSSPIVVYVAVTAYFLIFPPMLTVFGTLMMDKASDTHRHATFFTLQFSVMSVMGFVYAAIAMALAKVVGYQWVALAGVILAFGLCFYVAKKTIE